MCFSSGVAKVLDPSGFVAEKTTPKTIAPYMGLHGTVAKMRELQAPIQPSPLTTTSKPASQKLLGE